MSLLDAIPKCFSESYDEARRKFLNAGDDLGLTPKSYANPLTGPNGGTLATDCLWIGPEDAEKVLVMISATHGVEGFCGSACQIDWLLHGGAAQLNDGAAALLIHAINPHGFAWQRRVTEEGCDLNRNYVDFDKTLPTNPGHDELVNCFVPAALDDSSLADASLKIDKFRSANGEKAFQVARKQGQYKHAHSVFFGGFSPTWARRTLEAIINDYALKTRQLNVVIDYHTGLGPHGHGEPICCHLPDSLGLRRVMDMYGDFVGVPELGTSSSIPLNGTLWEMLDRKLGDKYTCVALEYGTYAPDNGLRAMQADHWLHNQGEVDWLEPKTQTIKAALKKHFYPASQDWKEIVLWRSRQVQRQSLACLMLS